jgi:hypothetical protein
MKEFIKNQSKVNLTIAENLINLVKSELTSKEKMEIEEVVYYSENPEEKLIPYINNNKDNLTKMVYLNYIQQIVFNEELN